MIEQEKTDLRSGIFGLLLFCALMYVLGGAVSLAMVAMGEDIPFMSFWHEPWRLVFQLFVS